MRLFSVLWYLLILLAPAMAQTPSARVVGRVTDGTGAVVPGVTIRVTDLDRNLSQQASSNEVGDYSIPYLNPGRYLLETKIDSAFGLINNRSSRLLSIRRCASTSPLNWAPPPRASRSPKRRWCRTPQRLARRRHQ